MSFLDRDNGGRSKTFFNAVILMDVFCALSRENDVYVYDENFFLYSINALYGYMV